MKVSAADLMKYTRLLPYEMELIANALRTHAPQRKDLIKLFDECEKVTIGCSTKPNAKAPAPITDCDLIVD